MALNQCPGYLLVRDNGIRYNVKKTVCMCVKPKARKHLKVPQVADDVDICRQLRSVYAQGNILLRKFQKCSDDIKCHLFRSYCTNLYCAVLWCNFTASAFRRIKVAYNNTFRMLMCVKRRQVYNAFVRFNVDSFQVILRKSVYSFNKRLLKSRNCIISNIMNSMSFLSGSKLQAHWEKVLYN